MQVCRLVLIEIRRAKNMWLNECKKITFEYFLNRKISSEKTPGQDLIREGGIRLRWNRS